MLVRTWRHTRCYWLAVIVSLAFAGCACLHRPVREHYAHGWLIVDSDLRVFDWCCGAPLTLRPFAKSVLGQKLFDKADRFLPSPDGRFIAVFADEDPGLYLINVAERSYRPVPHPGRVFVWGEISWAPGAESILCSCAHRLFMLDVHTLQWEGIEELSKDPIRITSKAWIDDKRFLFQQGKRITMFDLGTRKVTTCAEGESPFSVSSTSFICWRDPPADWSPDDPLDRPWTLVTQAAEISATPSYLFLRGNGITMNRAPIVSPDGRYVLFLQQTIGSMYWCLAINQDVCLYDVANQRFSLVVVGFWRGPSVEIVGNAVWIRADAKLRGHVTMKLK